MCTYFTSLLHLSSANYDSDHSLTQRPVDKKNFYLKLFPPYFIQIYIVFTIPSLCAVHKTPKCWLIILYILLITICKKVVFIHCFSDWGDKCFPHALSLRWVRLLPPEWPVCVFSILCAKVGMEHSTRISRSKVWVGCHCFIVKI